MTDYVWVWVALAFLAGCLVAGLGVLWYVGRAFQKSLGKHFGW